MSGGYYIHDTTGRTGPFDAVSLMRKLRAGKISLGTPISMETGEAYELRHYPELAQMAATAPADINTAPVVSAEKLFMHGLRSGVKLINRQLMVCVVAGVLVFMLLIIATVIGSLTSFVLGYASWLFMALALFPLLQLTCLRMLRGQYMNGEAFRRYVLMQAASLGAIGVALGASVTLGLTLLVPGIALFAILSLAAPLAADRADKAGKAIKDSVRMVCSGSVERFGALFGLGALNVLSLLTIITVPIIWPIVATAVAELYEEYTAHSV